MKERKIMLYIIIISFLCFVIASYIEINKYFAIDSCFTSISGCAIVDRSSFSDFAGLAISVIGIVGFLTLSLLSFIQYKNPNKTRKKIIFTLIVIMSLFALYLIFAQLFLIKAICKYCLVVDFLTLTMLVAILLI